MDVQLRQLKDPYFFTSVFFWDVVDFFSRSNWHPSDPYKIYMPHRKPAANVAGFIQG